MVFRSPRDLPRIGFAAMQAEGFVTLALPRVLRRRARPRRCPRAGTQQARARGGAAYAGVALGRQPATASADRGPGDAARGP